MSWKIDNQITRSKIKKYTKRYPEDTASVLGNLGKVKKYLDSGISFEQTVQRYPFLRSEKGHVFRIGNAKRTNAHETRLYICIEKGQQVIYLLELGDKNGQQEDIKTSHNKANRILA